MAELSDLLQASATAGEAYDVIAHAAQQLFPETAGALFIYSASRNHLEAMATWNDPVVHPNERVFAPGECWALRRGRPHRVDHHHTALPCKHVPSPLTGSYLCVPMMAHGETVGVLHIRQHPSDTQRETEDAAMKEWLVVPLAEHIALALANLKLRETLRNPSIRDPVTGLFNRRYMEETLEREIGRAERSQRPLGIWPPKSGAATSPAGTVARNSHSSCLRPRWM